MKRFLATLSLLLFIPSYCFGGIVIGGEYGSGTPDLYFNCDSTTSGQSLTLTIGSETVTVGANVTLGAGVQGNALITAAGSDESDRFFITPPDNFFTGKGQLGFYIKTGSDSDTYVNAVDFNSWYRVFFSVNRNNTEFNHGYQYCKTIAIGVDSSAWVHITLRWDDSTETVGIRYNGGSWYDSTSGDTWYSHETQTTMLKFGADSNSTIYFDQIMGEFGSWDLDLYELRNETSF